MQLMCTGWVNVSILGISMQLQLNITPVPRHLRIQSLINLSDTVPAANANFYQEKYNA